MFDKWQKLVSSNKYWSCSRENHYKKHSEKEKTSYLIFSKMLIRYYKYRNELIPKHLIMTEKFSFGWMSNHMPLTFQVSALTTRPQRPPISHCPSIQRTCFTEHHCGHCKMQNPSRYSIFSKMLIGY